MRLIEGSLLSCGECVVVSLIVECANVRGSVDRTHEGCGRQMAARFYG